MEPLELLGDGEILRAEPDGEQHVRVSKFRPALLRGSCQNHFGFGKIGLELLCSGWWKIWKAAESRRTGERNTDFGHCFPPQVEILMRTGLLKALSFLAFCIPAF